MLPTGNAASADGPLGAVCACQEPDVARLLARAVLASLICDGTSLDIERACPLPPGARPVFLRLSGDRLIWRNQIGLGCDGTGAGEKQKGDGTGGLHLSVCMPMIVGCGPNVSREWTATVHCVVKNGGSVARRCGSNPRACQRSWFYLH